MNSLLRPQESQIKIDNNPPQKENRLDTYCLGCVFEKDENNNKIECRMGVINKLKQQNISIILEKDSYRILGRICPYYRNKLWEERYREDIISQARKEAELRYDLIILVSTLTNLENCLNHICRLSIKPKNIIVVSEKISLFDLGKTILNSDIIKNSNINWRTEKLLQTKLEYSEWTPILITDYIAEKCTSTYFSIINDDQILPFSYFETLDKLLNDEMLPILVCKSSKGLHGSIYNKHAWNITKNIHGLEQWCIDKHPSKIINI